MKIIKCHTTSSTNDDLREYALENHSEETVALLAFYQKMVRVNAVVFGTQKKIKV